MNSVIILADENMSLKSPPSILDQDPLNSDDIGWVDQMIPMIREYSKQHHNVLDIFAGLGSTAIAAKMLNRNAFMIEINSKRSQLIQQRWDLNNQHGTADLKIFNSDTLSILKQTKNLPPIQLCLSNLPYFTAKNCEAQDFNGDLYNIENYHEYLAYLENCFLQLKKHLSGGASCIFTCENIRNKHDELIPLAWDIARIIQRHYVMFDERIMFYPGNKRKSSHPLHTNRQHEYVLIAKKFLSHNQCISLTKLINYLNKSKIQFTIFGSFTRFINQSDSLHIGDLDLLIPRDKDNLEKLLNLIVERHSITIWSWNNQLDFLDLHNWDFNEIFEKQYLRLMLHDQNNDSYQIDLMFKTQNT